MNGNKQIEPYMLKSKAIYLMILHDIIYNTPYLKIIVKIKNNYPHDSIVKIIDQH